MKFMDAVRFFYERDKLMDNSPNDHMPYPISLGTSITHEEGTQFFHLKNPNKPGIIYTVYPLAWMYDIERLMPCEDNNHQWYIHDPIDFNLHRIGTIPESYLEDPNWQFAIPMAYQFNWLVELDEGFMYNICTEYHKMFLDNIRGKYGYDTPENDIGLKAICAIRDYLKHHDTMDCNELTNNGYVPDHLIEAGAIGLYYDAYEFDIWSIGKIRDDNKKRGYYGLPEFTVPLSRNKYNKDAILYVQHPTMWFHCGDYNEEAERSKAKLVELFGRIGIPVNNVTTIVHPFKKQVRKPFYLKGQQS